MCSLSLGITPLISIYTDLHQRYSKGQNKPLRRILLLWSVRSEDELALFAERLHEVAKTESIFKDVDGLGPRFVTCLHVTGAKGELKITSNKAFAVLPQPTTEYIQVCVVQVMCCRCSCDAEVFFVAPLNDWRWRRRCRVGKAPFSCLPSPLFLVDAL
jgi:hypothetical protein